MTPPPKPKPTKKSSPAPASISIVSKPHMLASTVEFYIYDEPKTLFPMRTNRIIIENGQAEIEGYIQKCLDDKIPGYSFLPQRRVYAAKPERHLRRTLKLDPVAEYYLYDLAFRNKKLFRKPHTKDRDHYGYRFESGAPIPATDAYKAFRAALSDYGGKYKYSMSFDVASYFNGIYHHDLVSWIAGLGASDRDTEGFGQFLREVKSGRSIDCLPQGIYPAKMVGNDFLRFIDNYFGLQSEKFVRFMDDMTIFSNNENSILNDFELIQRILGEKGLSINPKKTQKGESSHQASERDIDSVKKNLLKRRRFMVTVGYDEDGEEVVKEQLMKWPLTSDEMKYIKSLLDKPEIEEDDAELILTLMVDHASKAEKRLPEIIEKFPHLIKSVFNFCSRVSDKEFLSDVILSALKSSRRLSEFELFWFGWILDVHLLGTKNASAIISLLFENPLATPITKAKILEISDQRFGLPDLRDPFLSGGQSDWMAWSSAVGTLSLKPITRNHKLKYFGSSSNMNHLIAVVLSK